jgi:hypothetical protein
MSSSLDFVSVADAARELGVEPSRVRALLARGQMEGEKIGGRWLVSGASVRERLRRAPKRGRRLRPANAWAVLALASGEQAPWVSSKDRRRLGGLVAARGLADLVDRLGDRARVEGFYAHPSVLSAIARDGLVLPAGAYAARDAGERIVAGDDLDFYVSEADLPALIGEYVLEPSDRPNVRARVLPAGLWPFSGGRMPLAAVAVDLAELPDARSRRVGRRLIEKIDGAGAVNRGRADAP